MSWYEILLIVVFSIIIGGGIWLQVKYPHRHGSQAPLYRNKKKEQMKVKEWVESVGQVEIKKVFEFDGGWIILKDQDEDIKKVYKDELARGNGQD